MADKKTAAADNRAGRFAWTRYRWLMAWMAIVSLVATVAALGRLWWVNGPLPLLFLAFTAGGIFFAILLAAALMGLAFLSSASGHDDQVQEVTGSDDDS